MPIKSWPDPHIDALKRHIAAGLTHSQIARELWREFSVSYSRNAVIGKASRMGLSTNTASRAAAVQNGAKHSVAVRRAKKPPSYSPRLGPVPMPCGEPIDRESNPAPLRCAEVEPLNIALEALEAHHCRFPLGGWPSEDPITFCGLHRDGDSSYCPAHHDLTKTDGRRPHAQDAATRHRRAAIANGLTSTSELLRSLESDEAA
jgi:GcrA cell cycle regulator